ncbi:MAG: cytochrome c peroxidase [Nitrosomonas sp.]|nr:cytochrome c peroxidase [Nitrosomonas sp.]
MKFIIFIAMFFSFHAFAQENDTHEEDIQTNSAHRHEAKNVDVTVENDASDASDSTNDDAAEGAHSAEATAEDSADHACGQHDHDCAGMHGRGAHTGHQGHGDHGGKMHGGGHGHGLDKTSLKQYFESLPESIIDEQKNAALIKLGKMLYLDPRLSINNKISCNSCHGLENFGVDNEPTSPGHDGRRGNRNSPTTMNAALHIAQFWDGRARDVEEQALGPILNPIEMGMPDKGTVVKKLKAIDVYQKLFSEAFSDQKYPFNYNNIGVAIGAFERTLLTPSRFDDFLNGEDGALSKVEKKGLHKFIQIGCATCHNGVAIGGNSFKKIGLIEPYETADLGRYEVTNIENDKHVFKVPGLRNVARTAPYFHDGSVATLEEAIRLMAKHQLGQEVGHGFIRDVKAFLESLTDKSAQQ